MRLLPIPIIRPGNVVPILFPKTGDGFSIRKFTREDAACLAEFEFDDEVKRFLSLPKMEKKQWIEKFDAEAYDGWAVDVNGILAGRASLLRSSRRGDGELAIIISREFWGMNLGRKVAALLIQAAFEVLDAKALVAKVHPNHKASIALLRSFKFRRCGVVVMAPEQWQEGHYVYRLSRGSYNKLAKR